MASPSKIFISYRREDSAHFANLLRYKLGEEFGKDQIIFDISQVRSGQRFDDVLRASLETSDVLVAVIGPKWKEMLTQREGKEDFVRQEISMALKRGMIVIPVVLDSVDIPNRSTLPAEIQEFMAHQAKRMKHETFEQDAKELIADIQFNRQQLRSKLRDKRRGKAPIPTSYGEPQGGRIALVIGNAAYQQSKALRHPVADAALLTHRLKLLGYKVIGGASVEGRDTGQSDGADLGSAATFELLGKFYNEVDIGSHVLVFYAGNAIQIASTNYLVPVDDTLDPTFPDLGLINLRAFIERVTARVGRDGVVVAFLDACRDNPLTPDQTHRLLNLLPVDHEAPPRASGNQAGNGLAAFNLSEMQDQGRAFIGFSTTPGAVAYDGEPERGNSPFAAALDRHLAVRGLEIEELFQRVALDVRDQVAVDLGRYQEPSRESNLVRSFYPYPSNAVPVAMLALLGGLAGFLICLGLIDAGGVVTGGSAWVWGLGLLLGCAAAFGTLRWGSRKLVDAALAFAWPAVGFAAALALASTAPPAATALPSITGSAIPLATHAFLVALLSGVALFAATRFTIWMRWSTEWPTTPLQWLSRTTSWLAPVAVLLVLVRLQDAIASGSHFLVASTLILITSAMIYTVSVALGCRSQGGIFATFEPGVGGAFVGMLLIVLLGMFSAIASRMAIDPSTHRLLLIAFGTAWHALLGAQLGYCFAHYVPDHRRMAR